MSVCVTIPISRSCSRTTSRLMFSASMILPASRTERLRGRLRTGEDIICSTVILRKSFPLATALFSRSVSVRIPDKSPLSETMMQDMFLSDMILAAETTELPGQTVATSSVIISPTSSQLREVAGKGLEQLCLIWLSTNSMCCGLSLFSVIMPFSSYAQRSV